MKITQLASLRNLELAWRRITTGGNHQYKRMYRPLYFAYEVALKQNLKDLRSKLIGGTYVPEQPDRMYVPKASGLHRPVTLLAVEDQVVLQAFANLAAARLQHRRSALQFRIVFSNILQEPDSIFFFRKWQETYAAFQERIEKHFDEGRRWVGDFDLAAFYDTISHELLIRTVYPRASSPDLEWFKSCLKVWSSDSAASGHGHGLPQGPLASDFLAECFLLPVDTEMVKCLGYVRYVDDVRLLGSTEDEVRGYLISLERHCRERGLIPQTGKFAIKRVHSLEEAMGMLPSIADPHHEPGPKDLSAKKAREIVFSAIDGRPYKVSDKTRLRYALYRAPADSRLLGIVLRLVAHHPEHTDVFFAYLGRFEYRKPIEELCLKLVTQNPYGYVRGEAWHILARYRRSPKSSVYRTPSGLTTRAVEVAKLRTQESFAERWGVLHFLCVSESVGGGRYSRFVRYQTPLIQALLGPALPDQSFAAGEAAGFLLRRTNPEPGLSICAMLPERRLTLSALGVRESEVATQVRNTLEQLGIITTRGPLVEPIADALRVRYSLLKLKSWRKLLGQEYIHALGLLRQAEAAYLTGRSFWLISQNSFNQVIFLALQRHFVATQHPGVCTTIDRNGQLVDFGVTLDQSGPFARACPSIASSLAEMNSRRNRLPVSHPYEKKTAAQSKYLTPKEQRDLVKRYRGALVDFQRLMP